MKKKTKSPIKSKLLHYSGQSLDDEIFELVTGKLVVYFLIIFCFAIATFFQWINFISKKPINPLLMTIIFLIVFIFSILKIIKIRKQLKTLKLGRDGERAVGQYLEELRILQKFVFPTFSNISGEVKYRYYTYVEKGGCPQKTK